MPPPSSRAFLLSLSSGAQGAQALVSQCLRLAAWHHGKALGWPTRGIHRVRLAWPDSVHLMKGGVDLGILPYRLLIFS